MPITRGVRYILAGFCGDASQVYAQQDDIDEEQERIDLEEMDADDGDDGEDPAALAKALADEAEMDLEALLPPGYLAQMRGAD